MSSIYDIAKILGISPSTVSRALSGRGYCNDAIKEKVLKVAEELNYAPLQAAKVLKTKKTEKVIFIIPDICNPFYFDMINGVNSVLEKYDYMMILYYTGHNIKNELRAIQNLKEKHADGMIMVSFNFCERNIKAIDSVGAPVVLTHNYDSPDGNDKFDCVFVDNIGIKQATEHLLKQGHQRIAYIGGSLREQTGYERYILYRDAILNAGLKVDEKYLFESNYSQIGGYHCGKKILSLEQKPTAVVASNDLMAVGFMVACKEEGFRIPDDIAVVGMDNTDICAIISPKLTSIAMMQEEIGRNAAQILMDRLHGDTSERRKVTLFPRLVVRESSIKMCNETKGTIQQCKVF